MTQPPGAGGILQRAAACQKEDFFPSSSISSRPGMVAGFVGGLLANETGAGFLGGIIAGFLQDI